MLLSDVSAAVVVVMATPVSKWEKSPAIDTPGAAAGVAVHQSAADFVAQHCTASVVARAASVMPQRRHSSASLIPQRRPSAASHVARAASAVVRAARAVLRAAGAMVHADSAVARAASAVAHIARAVAHAARAVARAARCSQCRRSATVQ